MPKDMRNTKEYIEARALLNDLRVPGSDRIADIADVAVSPAGEAALVTATIFDTADSPARTRILNVNLEDGQVRLLTVGAGMEYGARYSPAGDRVAFISDRLNPGDFQACLFEPASRSVRPLPRVEGWVESLRWSPDGSRLLLCVAGHGADLSSGQGAITTDDRGRDAPAWMPKVESEPDENHWRRAWILDIASGSLDLADFRGNVWECIWAGPGAVAAITSEGPSEGDWYKPSVRVFDIGSGASREIYASARQIAVLAACSDGRCLSVIEGLASDRGYMAGDLVILAVESGKVLRHRRPELDVSDAEWRGRRDILVAGHRGLATLVGTIDPHTGHFAEIWSSCEITASGNHAKVWARGGSEDVVLIGEGFRRPPELALLTRNGYRAIRSFAPGRVGHLDGLATIKSLAWPASDGLEIQGWMLCPHGEGPFPVIMNLHGGPLWHWRPRWLGRAAFAPLMLLRRGFALFYPNPRGSTGRGQDFASLVLGDMGVADAGDCLAGLDFLVAEGLADPQKLGVTGGSHGGYLTAWLITQDARFAAAVPVAPVTNFVSAQFTSNIPQFNPLFLGHQGAGLGESYVSRSPVTHAHQVTTPTLSICGAKDRCTPPTEAIQFHSALRQNGVESVLVTYPLEGHGIRSPQAAADYAARVTWWFAAHMRAGNAK